MRVSEERRVEGVMGNIRSRGKWKYGQGEEGNYE